MPKIEKIFVVDVTPEKFLNACSDEELQEVDLLLSSNQFLVRLKRLKE